MVLVECINFIILIIGYVVMITVLTMTENSNQSYGMLYILKYMLHKLI